MPSRINIGPDTGPFVELDEENGEFVIRVPEDEVNFDQSDLRNVKDFTAGSVSTERIGTSRGAIWVRDNNPIISHWSPSITEDIPSTTSESSTLSPISGMFMDYENVPDAATPVGRVFARITSNSNDEQAFLYPSGRDFGTDDRVEYDELQITVQSDSLERVDSGWIDLTSGPESGLVVGDRWLAGVEQGGEFEVFDDHNPQAGLAFGWRLD